MKYELIKSWGSRVIIMILLILLCVNGLEIYYHCKYYRQEIAQEDNYATEDYHRLISEAAVSIQNGQDVFLSKAVISEFFEREISNDAYDSREAEFVSYEKYAIYGLIIISLMTIFTIDTERKSGMNQIISIAPKRETKVFTAKQISLAANCLIINFIFLAEDIIICKMSGGLDLQMKLYNVPGYFGTWFSGNIFTYKILCTVGICMIQIVGGNLIYIFACVFKKNILLIFASTALSVAGLYLGNKIPTKYCFMNIFSFFNSECLSKEFIPVEIGNIYTYRLWLALIVLITSVFIVNICNFLIYRGRRTV